jgi:hypothetical protein
VRPVVESSEIPFVRSVCASANPQAKAKQGILWRSEPHRSFSASQVQTQTRVEFHVALRPERRLSHPVLNGALAARFYHLEP